MESCEVVGPELGVIVFITRGWVFRRFIYV